MKTKTEPLVVGRTEGVCYAMAANRFASGPTVPAVFWLVITPMPVYKRFRFGMNPLALRRLRQARIMQMQQPNEHRERVAYDLMVKIAQEDVERAGLRGKPREYYLQLYIQCLKAVSGEDYEDIMSPADTDSHL